MTFSGEVDWQCQLVGVLIGIREYMEHAEGEGVRGAEVVQASIPS
jgi:hypothetical protein